MQVHDEVCGMTIDSAEAADTFTLDGRKYYFCSERCRRKFAEHPEWYVETGPAPEHPSGHCHGGGR